MFIALLGQQITSIVFLSESRVLTVSFFPVLVQCWACERSRTTLPQAPAPRDRFNMLAAMLRQSSGGGSGGGSNSGSGGTKLPLGITRLSSSSFGNWVPGRDSKSCSLTTDASDIPASDPNYIMQLVSDVRKFADVLLQLKEVFNSKGILLKAFRRLYDILQKMYTHTLN